MRVGPFFKWFGSKWQSAKHYPAPVHSTIVEPYAGGAGYSCNYADRQVVLYEADPNLIELWRWLIGPATESEIRALPVGLGVGVDIRTLGLSAGAALLVKHWQRTDNVGNCWTTSPWCDKPGQWTASTRARVAEQITAIKHWRLGGPAPSVATWFVDPPYLFNRRYRGGRDFDYAALGAFVRALPPENQVIVCEARSKTGEMPDWLPFVDSHRSVTSRRKAEHSHHSPEVVYLQGPQR